MTKFIGRQKNVGIARELTRGLGVDPTFVLPKADYSVLDKATKTKDDLGYGTIAGAGNQSLVALRWAEGNIGGSVLSKPFGLFLYSLLGACSSTGPTDSLYTHAFSLLESVQHPTLTISVADPLQTVRYRNSLVDKLELTIKPDDTVRYVAGFKAFAHQDGTTYTPTQIADAMFLGRHLTFKIAADTSSLAAATAISLKELKLTIEQNVVLDNVLGSIQPEDILNQVVRISGDLTLNMESVAYRDYMLNGSYKAVRIDLTNPDYLIGASSHPQFTLDLSRVDFEGWDENTANDKITTQKITFVALYDVTNNNVVDACTLKNAQVSY